jgi:hypothetical protein
VTGRHRQEALGARLALTWAIDANGQGPVGSWNASGRGWLPISLNRTVRDHCRKERHGWQPWPVVAEHPCVSNQGAEAFHQIWENNGRRFDPCRADHPHRGHGLTCSHVARKAAASPIAIEAPSSL